MPRYANNLQCILLHRNWRHIDIMPRCNRIPSYYIEFCPKWFVPFCLTLLTLHSTIYISLYCICIVLCRIALCWTILYVSLRYIISDRCCLVTHRIPLHCLLHCNVLLHQQCTTQWYFLHRILPLHFSLKFSIDSTRDIIIFSSSAASRRH